MASFARSVQAAYGSRLVSLVLFGSRARGDARPDSDLDIAVILDRIENRANERNRLSDLAYDTIIETAIEVQAWPLSLDEWSDPEGNRNRALVEAIKRDGRLLTEFA